MATDAKTIVPLRYKVTRRFYEPLLLLDALGNIRGGRSKSEPVSDNTGTNHTQLRRSFADAIAYICAYQKGRDNVTAAALESTPQGVVVWLAANTKIEDKVVQFLKSVLAQLMLVVDQDDAGDRQQAAQLATDRLSSMITDFHMPRLTIYHTTILKVIIQPCQEVLAEYCKKSVLTKDKDALQVTDLQEWLTRYFGQKDKGCPQPSFLDIVTACHNIRHTHYLKTVGVFAGQGQTRAQEFERLYKLLGKLGRPITSSKRLVKAAMNLSQDLIQGFTVKRLSPSKATPLPFKDKEETTIKSIVGRMFSSKEEQDDFMNRLSFLEDREIIDFIQEVRPTKTRVHAELLLIDHFERNGCNFLDSHEKYIGCSKPACYLCHMYIAQHPGRYVVPACHNKLYLAWRAPDVFVGDVNSEVLTASQEKIILGMLQTIRRDLSNEIYSRTMRRPFHPDSTTGITSTLDSASVDGYLSSERAFLHDQGEPAADVTNANDIADLSTLEGSDGEGWVAV